MKRLVLFSLSVALIAGAANTRAGDTKAKSDAQEGKGEIVTLDDLKSPAPADWEKQKPSINLRLYQFRIPKVEGDPKDAELLIFNFGPGGGGTVKDNLERWKAKFRAPEGKTLADVTKVEEFKVGKVPVTYLDVSGTYLYKFPPFAANAKTTPLPDYRMLGVIFASENGPYYITVTGPAPTLAHQKKAFDNWLKSFK
jgi:hypothetical protein